MSRTLPPRPLHQLRPARLPAGDRLPVGQRLIRLALVGLVGLAIGIGLLPLAGQERMLGWLDKTQRGLHALIPGAARLRLSEIVLAVALVTAALLSAAAVYVLLTAPRPTRRKGSSPVTRRLVQEWRQHPHLN